ncbi:MAG: class I SAM-dependent methyltransferase [Smithellaceae bacterium]|nr:class I SAM-dependent methyltransferase [Smithellaceae bacterium]
MTGAEIYEARKQFFNDSAEKWIDLWYRDPETGRQDKHAKDFERLFSLLPLKTGDSVLDAGCGTGVLVPYLLHAVGVSGTIYELDFAARMIEINRRLHRAANIRFLVADVENAPLERQSCDAAVCFSCFPHFSDKERAIEALAGLLKPRGILAIAHFASAEGINAHHKTCAAVRHDRLPEEGAMRKMIAGRGFAIEAFIDEEGFYYLQARKKT